MCYSHLNQSFTYQITFFVCIEFKKLRLIKIFCRLNEWRKYLKVEILLKDTYHTMDRSIFIWFLTNVYSLIISDHEKNAFQKLYRTCKNVGYGNNQICKCFISCFFTLSKVIRNLQNETIYKLKGVKFLS